MSDFTQQGELSAGSVRIKIVGLGGAGSSMIDRFRADEFATVPRVAVNTDAQALAKLSCDEKVLIGASVTRGLGTGGEPEIGKAAAEADRKRLAELVEDVDLLILVVGLGGGTGTALVTLLAELAAGTEALVLAFATVPFSFEGARRKKISEACLGTLRKWVHGLIPLPNDMLLQESEETTSALDAFAVADRWVERAVGSLCALLLQKGLINQDFGSLRSVFQRHGGKTLFGIGFGEGEDSVKEALEQLFLCPLFHTDDCPTQPDRILINLVVGPDVSLSKINEVIAAVSRRFSTREDILFGAVVDPKRSQSLEICVLGKAEMEPAVATTVDKNESARLQFAAPQHPQASASQSPWELSKSRAVHRSKLKSRHNKKNDAQDEFVFDQTEEQRGYFEKTDRNEYRGEDLDVPTYLRRGIRIRLKV